MCGIAGIWGDVNESKVQSMIEAQRHRGPDGYGVHVHVNQGILGHTRLSIMDPAQGQQPIHNEDHSATLVANGMVYNHPQLRRQLGDSHAFSSDSDSETILHLYEDHGLSTPRLLDGMFAFAISSNNRLILARDRIGIKPLYYARQSQDNGAETIYFASELKALTPLTEEIKEFPPGTLYDSESGFHTYYQVPNQVPLSLDLAVHIRRVRETIEAAVKKRLLSDVPLGAFLSGGLDSSIITAVAKKYMSELHTFSVGVEGSRDLEAARHVARHIGSIHHEYVCSAAEVVEKLPEIIYHLESFDQDLVRSAIPTWFCARMAADKVKVILTGEGADELFAGYTYHKGITDYQALHSELRRSVTRLHNINLQRVDRMTMRHAIEARVPFLDADVIAMAQTVPPELKLKTGDYGLRIEKWILRKAFEDLLPPEIVWRDKEQFDEGSGMVDLLPAVLECTAAGIDTDDYKVRFTADRLRSNEECFYHRLLIEQFEQPQAVLASVGRWQLD
ncbi:MAG: asparagine synthase B [Gammaproteobacteria bacterium]|nr:MAG: asparagine synthase B [Gammaproteobacteria bacterium]